MALAKAEVALGDDIGHDHCAVDDGFQCIGDGPAGYYWIALQTAGTDGAQA